MSEVDTVEWYLYLNAILHVHMKVLRINRTLNIKNVQNRWDYFRVNQS